MNNEDYWFWATNIKNINYKKLERLFKIFGGPYYLYKSSVENLKCINCLSDEDIFNIVSSKDENTILLELETLYKKGISFIYPESKMYPEKLKNIYMKPFSLYIIGEMPSADTFSVAIVGARKSTIYGDRTAEKIAGNLSLAGVNVISGMATGIDSAAQWGAIKAGGKTFSVLGSGIDICYPSSNKNLYGEIPKKGGIISEYPPGVKAEPWRFPLRNRIISGLADKLLVVEAKEKSGTCITVEYALEQGKDVYAVPGRITDCLSSGCNKLIKQGANIFTGINDILPEEYEINEKPKEKKPIAKDLEVLYACVDFIPKSLNNIIEETGIESKEVIKGLTRLELMDLVYEPIKNHYSIKE